MIQNTPLSFRNTFFLMLQKESVESPTHSLPPTNKCVREPQKEKIASDFPCTNSFSGKLKRKKYILEASYLRER